ATFVEEGRVRGVQILRLASSDDAPAEANDASARVADREHQAAAEAAVGLAALGLDDKADFDQLCDVDIAERSLERAAAVGCETEPECLDGRGFQAALFDVSPC